MVVVWVATRCPFVDIPVDFDDRGGRQGVRGWLSDQPKRYSNFQGIHRTLFADQLDAVLREHVSACMQLSVVRASKHRYAQRLAREWVMGGRRLFKLNI